MREKGYQGYLAGGCVRDHLLGKPPQDYDIATDARPETVQEIFPRTLAVGTQFGVILVIIDGEPFEVATFRHDGPYLDGRRPSHVRFASLQEDILRRDFTINGMMYDPVADRVIDLVGGRDDLSRRVVRAIGDPQARFREDRLRMVRAVRFAAGLGFAIEAETLRAIAEQAAGITQISWERIGEEVTRILTEGGAKKGFELLDATGLLRAIFPEIEAMKGVEQTPDFHPEGDVFTHTLLMLGHLTPYPSESLAYGCLLHDIAKPVCVKREAGRVTFYGHSEKGAEIAVEILKRLKRSRAVWERAAYLVKSHLRHTQAPKMRLSTLKRFLGEEGIEELLELVRIDALSANGDLQYYDFCRRKMAELKAEQIHPEPLLRGRELIEMGFTPGPLFQKILHQVEEAQLEGELRTKEQAMAWVMKHYGQSSS
ncbi:MAG: CCA tRNA nucleotidyltransferase [Deltaproteobacteria bacterium]|nr:CCA tRNA nucleotidyltransferase [Deltaproteobacteria bacterium]MBI2990948.1 CCA tRNA nucleotidyltransferase [Deltaproteobacteria bacterium]